MEARDAHRLGAAILAVCLFSAAEISAATFKTTNFVVTAPTADVAEEVGKTAEMFRRELAIEWLGQEMPAWSAPCPISVKVGQLGAGGATTFSFDRGEVFGWKMNIQGSLERILDSVLPHEVSHTIFACHFRRPLPRWADEGAATLVEHESERRRQTLTVQQVIKTDKRIGLRNLFSMKEYPRDMRDVLTLYAEGYSLADWLVQRGGKSRYLAFIEDAHRRGWDAALSQHYGMKSVEDFEKVWTDWVLAGSPPLAIEDARSLASNSSPSGKQPNVAAGNPSGRATDGSDSAPAFVVRGQTPRGDNPGDGTLARNRTENDDRGSDLEAPSPSAKRLRDNGGRPASDAADRSFAGLGAGYSAPYRSDAPRSEFPVGSRPGAPLAGDDAHARSGSNGSLAQTESRPTRPSSAAAIVRIENNGLAQLDNGTLPARSPTGSVGMNAGEPSRGLFGSRPTDTGFRVRPNSAPGSSLVAENRSGTAGKSAKTLPLSGGGSAVSPVRGTGSGESAQFASDGGRSSKKRLEWSESPKENRFDFWGPILKGLRGN